MNEFLILTTPAIYLSIVGVERVCWRSRYEQIKADVPLNLIALTASSAFITGLIWITKHVEICWK